MARTLVIKHADATVTISFMKANIAPGSTVHTDESEIYTRLSIGCFSAVTGGHFVAKHPPVSPYSVELQICFLILPKDAPSRGNLMTQVTFMGQLCSLEQQIAYNMR
jgi:hypothetical protein